MRFNYPFAGICLAALSISSQVLLAIPGQDLSNQDLTQADTVSVDWTDEDWTSGIFGGTTFSTESRPGTFVRTDFSGADFSGEAFFDDANLNGARFNNIIGFSTDLFLFADDVRGIELKILDLTEADFSTVGTLSSSATYALDLTGAVFDGSTLLDTVFTDVILSGASFDAVIDFSFEQLYDASDVRAVRLTNIDLTGAQFDQFASTGNDTTYAGDLSGANFNGSDITDARFTDVNVNGADFSGTTGFDLSRLDSATDVRGINLSGLNLDDADFTRTAKDELEGDLTGAIFDGVSLVGANFQETSLSNASFDNSDVSNANFRRAGLVGSSWAGTTVREANFSFANLSNVDLSGSDLRGARLTSANISGVNFTDAILNGVSLSASAGFQISQLHNVADARNIRLAGLDLTNADFSLVASSGTIQVNAGDLSGASFAGANLASSIFTDVNLNGASFDMATSFSVSMLNDVADARGVSLSLLDLSVLTSLKSLHWAAAILISRTSPVHGSSEPLWTTRYLGMYS